MPMARYVKHPEIGTVRILGTLEQREEAARRLEPKREPSVDRKDAMLERMVSSLERLVEHLAPEPLMVGSPPEDRDADLPPLEGELAVIRVGSFHWAIKCWERGLLVTRPEGLARMEPNHPLEVDILDVQAMDWRI